MGASNSNEDKEEVEIKTRITEDEELIIPISSSKRKKTPRIETVESSPLQISQPSPNPGRPKNRVLNQRKKRRSKPV